MKDTDFSEIHDNMKAVFDTALVMVDKDNIDWFDHDETDNTFLAPTLLIEAPEIETTDTQLSGGKLLLDVNYAVHCVLPRSNGLKLIDLECMNFAALVLKTVFKNSWGIKNVQLPTELRALPGEQKKGSEGFVSWVVYWSQKVVIGGGIVLNTGTPNDILVSEVPEIGRPHEDKYESVEDGFIL